MLRADLWPCRPAPVPLRVPEEKSPWARGDADPRARARAPGGDRPGHPPACVEERIRPAAGIGGRRPRSLAALEAEGFVLRCGRFQLWQPWDIECSVIGGYWPASIG